MAFASIIEGFIHEKLKQNPDEYSRSKVLIGFSLSLSIAVIIYSVIFYFFGQIACGTAVVIGGVLFFSSALIAKYNGSFFVASNVLAGSFYFAIAALSILDGGISIVSSPWFGAVAICSVLVAGVRSGLFWVVSSAITILILFVMQINGVDFPKMDLTAAERTLMIFTGLSGLTIIIGAFGVVFSTMIAKMVVKIRETGQLVQDNMASLQDIISELEQVMADIASGDFTRKLESSDVNNDIDELRSRLNGPLSMLTGIISKVVDVSEKIFRGSEDLSQSAQSLSSGSSEQAASLEEISSSLAEVEKQTTRNKDSATEACQLIENANQSVISGNKNMTSLLQSMNEISETSKKVAGVIKTIDEIAFQTNLLALNAAVEAARAGKYGKGFAVVAEEVRSLASRSALAAKSTTELIESSVREVNEGVAESSLTADSLKTIAEEVQKVDSIVKNITESSVEQNAVIQEINKGLIQVNSVVQNNTAIAEETASTSDELLTSANELQGVISSFSNH